MALLRVVETLTGLRREVQDFGADSDLIKMYEALQGLVSQNMPEGDPDETENLKVSFEVGTNQSIELVGDTDPDDRVGVIVFAFELPIAEELAYNFRDPEGPVAEYLDGVLTGLADAMAGLPDEGAALIAAMGLGDEAVSIDIKVTVRLHEFVPHG